MEQKIEILQKQSTINVQEKADLIWSIADKLRGIYKPHEYGNAILPLCVIKRFADTLKYEVCVIVGGNTYTFNVEVDGTAPTLKLNGVENGGATKDGVKLTNVSETAEVKVFKDGKEIKYKLGDELTEVGKYKTTVTDECGNQTTYEFEIETSASGLLIFFIIVGVLLVVGIVIFFIVKRQENI